MNDPKTLKAVNETSLREAEADPSPVIAKPPEAAEAISGLGTGSAISNFEIASALSGTPPRNDAAGEVSLGVLRTFLEMIKFEHSLFALPFAYLGLFLAEGGWPRGFVLGWVTVAMVSFRTFAMAVNRLLDCPIDAQNPRTRGRALPQKKLSLRFVTGMALISLLVFEVSAWLLGRLCFFLSPVPVILASIYPLLKRFTWLSHTVLGIILGIAPYGAWIASRGEFSWTPGFLLIGVASWVAGFDILYSLQDVEFDQKWKLHSVPVRFGTKRALKIAAFLHLVALLAWATAGGMANLGWVYALGMTGVAAFLLREHWLIRRIGLVKIEEAFFRMNVGVSLVIFLSTVVDLGLKSFQ